MYINLRCRKCGQYLSMKTEYPYFHGLGYMMDIKYHNCPNGVIDGEKIFCDAISISDKPIGQIISK